MQSYDPVGCFVSTRNLVPPSPDSTMLFAKQTYGAGFATSLTMPNKNFYGRKEIPGQNYPYAGDGYDILRIPVLPAKLPGFEIPNGPFQPNILTRPYWYETIPSMNQCFF